MKILMIAPEPCFDPRGTPFSVFHRCTALGKLGHTIDLVTYHLGEEKTIPGVRVYRTPKISFIKHVKIGPSLTKIPLDILVFLKSVMLLLRNDYQCLHTHEEAALMGVILRKIFNLPHIYDMHSSIPQQLSNFNFTNNRSLISLAAACEKFIIRHSDAVIVICPDLEATVRTIDNEKLTQLIENTPLGGGDGNIPSGAVESLRDELHLGPENSLIILYTGTMEPYQGIDLLLESFPLVVQQYPFAKCILVGGEDQQISALNKLSEKLQIKDHVMFIGKRPPEEMPVFMEMADVLVSPRNFGTNTPLKLYSYLKSGKPIVATDLLTHTQVLDSRVAVLTKPDPKSFAEGIMTVLSDYTLAEKLGNNARALAQSKYSYNTYLKKTDILYRYIASVRRTV